MYVYVGFKTGRAKILGALPASRADTRREAKNDEIDATTVCSGIGTSRSTGTTVSSLRWCTDRTILRYVARPIQWAVIRRDRLVGRPLPLKVSPALSSFGFISIKNQRAVSGVRAFFPSKAEPEKRYERTSPLILPAESSLLFILLVLVGEKVLGSPIINQSSVRTPADRDTQTRTGICIHFLTVLNSTGTVLPRT